MNLRQFFTKKKIIWSVIILLLIGGIGYRCSVGKNTAGNIQTDVVKRQNLQQTVLATGQVVSSTDLQLSFKSAGVVSRVNVKEGDAVKTGTVLATLDQKDQLATLTQAQGALAQAQASYSKVLAGAASQDIAVAQAAVDSAKTALANAKVVQAQAVANALAQLVGLPAVAVPASSNTSTATLTVTGTYNGTEQGAYVVQVNSSNATYPTLNISGLESNSLVVNRTSQTPIGTHGLSVQISSTGTLNSGDTWTISIPNTQSASYAALNAAYQSALVAQKQQIDAAQSALDQAQAALSLKAAPARQVDIDAAKAQILTAQGQVQAAEANLEHTIIRAPADGTVTRVDVKVGEQASPSVPVLILQDIGNLHIEANVSEADIAGIQPGQSIDVTFDALGPERHFTAMVQTIDPASTVISGVVNYKVKASIAVINDIKPGMTANMTIMVAKKDGVLALLQQAIINKSDGQYVRVVDDPKTKTYHEVKVQTGLQADGGMVEIVQGLNEGQEVVTYIKM